MEIYTCTKTIAEYGTYVLYIIIIILMTGVMHAHSLSHGGFSIMYVVSAVLGRSQIIIDFEGLQSKES